MGFLRFCVEAGETTRESQKEENWEMGRHLVESTNLNPRKSYFLITEFAKRDSYKSMMGFGCCGAA